MLDRQRIAVVVPAFNEAAHIQHMIRSLPAYVDDILVVDDGSNDGTGWLATQLSDGRTRLLTHDANRGVGAAIITGYEAATQLGCDVAVVMAGDGQMHPDDLPNVLLPILQGEADYVKGNRLAWPGGAKIIPPVRRIGIHCLTALTRLASGLTHLSDFQCGFTALRLRALDGVDLSRLYPRYGFPNDLIIRLALAGIRIEERPVRPVYEGQRSDLRVRRVIAPLAAVLARGVLERFGRATGSAQRTDRPAVTLLPAHRQAVNIRSDRAG